jgi:hypothetical protein
LKNGEFYDDRAFSGLRRNRRFMASNEGAGMIAAGFAKTVMISIDRMQCAVF